MWGLQVRSCGCTLSGTIEDGKGYKAISFLLDVPFATGTHFIKSGLSVYPVLPFRAVYSSKPPSLRRFTQFMQLTQVMRTEQFMQVVREHKRPVPSGLSDLVWFLHQQHKTP